MFCRSSPASKAPSETLFGARSEAFNGGHEHFDSWNGGCSQDNVVNFWVRERRPFAHHLLFLSETPKNPFFRLRFKHWLRFNQQTSSQVSQRRSGLQETAPGSQKVFNFKFAFLKAFLSSLENYHDMCSFDFLYWANAIITPTFPLVVHFVGQNRLVWYLSRDNQH